MAGIKFVSQDFILSDINPFTGMKYDDKWVYMELTETEDYLLLDKTENHLFQIYVSELYSEWHWRIMDFIGYESEYGKNIIINIGRNDYEYAKEHYRGHSYKDKELRDYEKKILVHSTPYKNYCSIKKMNTLLSWNKLKEAGIIGETEPIGSLLGDHAEYRDYIMFSDGGVGGEIVVNSHNHSKLIMDIKAEYEPGARMYFDAQKIAADGKLVRDGLHYKVKDYLPLNPYLLGTATKDNVDLPDMECSPVNFSQAADKMFLDLMP